MGLVTTLLRLTAKTSSKAGKTATKAASEAASDVKAMVKVETSTANVVSRKTAQKAVAGGLLVGGAAGTAAGIAGTASVTLPVYDTDGDGKPDATVVDNTLSTITGWFDDLFAGLSRNSALILAAVGVGVVVLLVLRK